MRARDIPARDRLLAKLVPQPNGCWHWTGFIDKAGYGRIGYKGRRSETVQRAVFMEFVGPIPEGHDIDHGCHSSDPTCVRQGTSCLHRRCGNPDHLQALPRDEHRLLNVGRSSLPGNRPRVTHCPHGHAYDEENTYHHGGRRFCRTCMTKRSRAYKAKKRAAA